MSILFIESKDRSMYSKHSFCSYLKHSDNGPQQGIKVFPVRNGVSILHLLAEFASKQMHSKNAVLTVK